MELEEIRRIARRKPVFLLKLSHNCREIMINTVNEAFDRKYTTDDEIEILSYKTFSIKADLKRIYELKLAPVTGRGLAICIYERESTDSTDAAAQLYFDELVLDTGNVAIVLSQDFDRDFNNIHCIIDAPGGSVKFAIPTVKLRYPSLQIIDVFMRWAI